MSPTSKPTRWEELACDATLVGLDDAERAELEALGVDADTLLALERAAGEVAAAAVTAAELTMPMPRDVEASVLSRLDEGMRRPADVLPLRPRAEARVEEAPRTSWLPWTVAAAAVVLAAVGWSRGTPPAAERVEAPPVSADAAARPPEVVASTADAAAPVDRGALLAMAGTARLPWSATKDPAARSAEGDVVWHGGLQHGFMSFRGLASNDPAKAQYQLWIFDAERDDAYPIDGGVFDVGPGEEVVVPIDPKLRVGRAKLFAVTVEKPGGVVVSKRERIVVTAAPRG